LDLEEVEEEVVGDEAEVFEVFEEVEDGAGLDHEELEAHQKIVFALIAE